MSHRQKIILATVYALLSSLFFALFNGFSKIARDDLSVSTILFFRFVIALLITIPFILRSKGFSLKTKCLHLHITRILITFGSIYCIFHAIKYISLFNTTLYEFAYPLYIPILILILFRKRLSLKMVFGIVLGFIGIVFVVHPSESELINRHAAIALLGGFLLAIVYLVIRAMHKKASALEMNIYYPLLGVILAGIVAPFNWTTPTAQMLPLLVTIGICATLDQAFIVQALKHAHASLVAPLTFSTILFSAIFEAIYWHAYPNLYEWIGFIFITLGGCITVWISGQSNHLLRKTPGELGENLHPRENDDTPVE